MVAEIWASVISPFVDQWVASELYTSTTDRTVHSDTNSTSLQILCEDYSLAYLTLNQSRVKLFSGFQNNLLERTYYVEHILNVSKDSTGAALHFTSLTLPITLPVMVSCSCIYFTATAQLPIHLCTVCHYMVMPMTF